MRARQYDRPSQSTIAGGAQKSPPVGWSPAYFGDDLAFNVTSIEAPDTNPAWRGLYDIPDGCADVVLPLAGP